MENKCMGLSMWNALCCWIWNYHLYPYLFNYCILPKRKRLNPILGSIGMESTTFSCRGSLIWGCSCYFDQEYSKCTNMVKGIKQPPCYRGGLFFGLFMTAQRSGLSRFAYVRRPASLRFGTQTEARCASWFVFLTSLHPVCTWRLSAQRLIS